MVQTLCLTRQRRGLVESCICPIRIDLAGEAEEADKISEPYYAIPPIQRRALLRIHVEILDLLGSDLSQHLSAYLHANEV